MINQFRDVRIQRSNAFVIFRRRIIDRKCCSVDGEYVLIKNVSFNIASKLLNWINFELYVNNQWIKINFKDLDSLKKIYQPIQKKDSISDSDNLNIVEKPENLSIQSKKENLKLDIKEHIQPKDEIIKDTSKISETEELSDERSFTKNKKRH